MFPEITFILAGLILLGMIIYRVDELRLGNDQDEIKNRLPEVKIVNHIRRVIDSVIYFVGIRIWKMIRAIRRKFRKKQLTDKGK